MSREHKIAVLNKAALDAASELDALKVVANISDEERARIAQLVERVYTACEQVGVECNRGGDV